MNPFTRRITFCTLLMLATAADQEWRAMAQAEGAKPAEPIVLREALAIEPVAKYGRVPVYIDYLVADLVAGKWKAPNDGDQLQLPNGPARTWKKMTADKNGWLSGKPLLGGYACWQVESDSERVMMLDAQGHSMVYVNGEPRVGDVYSHGYVKIPVLLKKGKNEFLFHAGRGKLRAQLTAPAGELLFNPADLLLPDVLLGETSEILGSVPVINTTTMPQTFMLGYDKQGQTAPANPQTITLPPLNVRKVPFRISVPADKAGEHKTQIMISHSKVPKVQFADRLKVTVNIRKQGELYKLTFESKIDGSVQYYAVRPAIPLRKNGPAPALVLSLHGASVEATGQSAAYGAKSWAHIVAPTNRRPFGFDWEDWGRMDAIEVLDHAQKHLKTDPQRTYLTGHSMGGHGTWHIGATYPHRFAAIGPSAGWITFWTYGAKKWEAQDPLYPLIDRASNPSDTFALARNFQQHGVYVLHGDADDNVPVSQARQMKSLLSRFHKDFDYFEQPKAGHWWDAHSEPGADCVDWAPMFDFFARRVIPPTEAVRQVQFATTNPGISAWSHWVGIDAQIKHLQPSSVKVRVDPGVRLISGTTDNVARIAFDLTPLPPGKPIQIDLDGQKFKDVAWPANGGTVWLERKSDTWAVTAKPSAATKGPYRYGPFREVYNNRVLFVYGSKGTPEENAWAYAKARFDAETFWYQGNGSIEVIPDTEFDDVKTKDRNVVLFGNADTNAAWKVLLAKSPVKVHRDHVQAGNKKIAGENLACLFLQPRPGSDTASVGVVSGTGLKGMMLTDRLKIFVSGAGVPDFVLFGPELPARGYGGVLGAGYFGLDWSVESGEFMWRDDKGA